MARKKKRPAHRRKSSSRPLKRGWSLERIFKALGITAIALLLSSQLTYTKDFRESNVLGEGESAQEEQQREEEKKREEDRRESQNSGPGNQNSNTQRSETEVERDGVKVKTKIEDSGARKIEIEGEGIRFKFEQKDGEVRLRAQNDDGEEIEGRDDEIEELEAELEDEDIDVATEDGHMVIKHNRIRARTNFPLSIDPVTRELIVTTPNGERAVAILPDEAIQNMLAQGFLTSIASTSAQPEEATTSGQPTESIEISLHNGNVVYEIKGEREHTFLGFFPVTTPQTVMVSAQSGAVIAQSQSWLSTFIDFLSF